jgi:hypothetical protein
MANAVMLKVVAPQKVISNPSFFSGTNLLPPELDHFNRATVPPSVVSSDDENGSENGKEKSRKPTPAASTTNTPAPTPTIAPGSVRKSASNLLTKKQQQQSKHLPPSVRALQKKYVERRLVRN